MATPEPGPGEVRVRVHWSGVNRSDVKRRAGTDGRSPEFPRVVPHMDGSGVIDRVGDGVDAARVGTRVWLHRAAWQRPLGTAAEYTVVPAARALPLPDGCELRTGASLGVPAMTAHQAVFGSGPVAGRTVLVTGGAGAVGFYAIQLARWAGARVLATASGGPKSEAALRAGAEAVIDYRREDVVQRVLALTGGAGVEHAVEVDFGANLPVLQRVLRPHGSIATYSSVGQPNPALPFYALLARNLRLQFIAVYDQPQAMQDRAAADIARWLSAGGMQLPPFHEYTLDDVACAHEAVEAGVHGKVVLRVG